jgi:hypothetical protein
MLSPSSRIWVTLLLFSLIVGMGSIVWHAWIFDRVTSGQTLGAGPVEQRIIVDALSLEEIKEIFAERAEEMAKYREGEYSFQDPSF